MAARRRLVLGGGQVGGLVTGGLSALVWGKQLANDPVAAGGVLVPCPGRIRKKSDSGAKR